MYIKSNICLFISGVFIFSTICVKAESNSDRTKAVEALVRTELEQFEQSLDGSHAAKDGVATRNLSHAALAYMLLGKGDDHGVAKAIGFVKRAFAAQNMKEGSPNFGNVPWNIVHPDILDPNAIEFTTSALAPLFIDFGDRFPKEFLDQSLPHLHGCLAAIAKHEVPLSYTNIALMKISNQILLGEYLHDDSALEAGKTSLDDWVAYTKGNGIGEFDSPTYSQTQLSVLYELYHNVHDANIKAKVKVILDYFWTTLAANFYPESGWISGPNSRTYDFLGNDYNLSQIYYLNGLPAQVSTERVYLSDEVQIWAAAYWNDYAPPAEAMNLANEPIRLIQERFGSLPGEERTNYITPDYTIGSVGRSYGPQDRLVVATLASKDLPFISIVPDVYDAPFGKIKTVDKSGHSKIHHLVVPISSVQNRNQVLTLLDLAPGLKKTSVSSVATNVLIPLAVDSLMVDGQPVDWKNNEVPLNSNSVIGIRQGKAGVAVRLFAADALPGSTLKLCLKNDGEEWGAARIVAYHYQGPSTSLESNSVHSGVLLLADHCETPADFQTFLDHAKNWSFTQTQKGSLWTVTARSTPGPSGTILETSLDQATKQTGSCFINSEPVSSPLLTINNVDWAANIWKELPSNLQLLDLASDRLLINGLYLKNHLTRNVQIDDDGAVGANILWEQKKSSKWFIEEQREGADLIQAGIALKDDKLINRGIKVLDWGFSHEADDGEFTDTSDAVHSVSFFVEAVSRAILLLQQAHLTAYDSHIQAWTPHLSKAAEWLIKGSADEKSRVKDLYPFTHRYYICGVGLAQTAAILHDNDMDSVAKDYIRLGIKKQEADGTNPEKGGFDGSYQAYGLSLACQYTTICTDAALKKDVETMIMKGLDRVHAVMRPDGTVDISSSTRVGKEADRMGVTKQMNYRGLTKVLVWANLTTGTPSYREMAEKTITHVGQ